MTRYVQYGDRFIPRDILYSIEYPEAAERQRSKKHETHEPRPWETFEMFDMNQLRGSKRSLEQLYRDAIGE